MVKIYALLDPRNNNIFYVGATSMSLKERLAGHSVYYDFIVVNKSYVKERSDLIRELKTVGLKPDIILLEEVEFDEVDFYEKSYYELFTSFGFDLIQGKDKFKYSKVQHKHIKNNGNKATVGI